MTNKTTKKTLETLKGIVAIIGIIASLVMMYNIISIFVYRFSAYNIPKEVEAIENIEFCENANASDYIEEKECIAKLLFQEFDICEHEYEDIAFKVYDAGIAEFGVQVFLKNDGSWKYVLIKEETLYNGYKELHDMLALIYQRG